MEADGFDAEDLPEFNAHDIFFDRPCLQDKFMGFISYKKVDRLEWIFFIICLSDKESFSQSEKDTLSDRNNWLNTLP